MFSQTFAIFHILLSLVFILKNQICPTSIPEAKVRHKLLGFYWWNKEQVCSLLPIGSTRASSWLCSVALIRTDLAIGKTIPYFYNLWKPLHTQAKNQSHKTHYRILLQRRPTPISPYCPLAIVFTSALNMLWWNDFDCTPVHTLLFYQIGP